MTPASTRARVSGGEKERGSRGFRKMGGRASTTSYYIPGVFNFFLTSVPLLVVVAARHGERRGMALGSVGC